MTSAAAVPVRRHRSVSDRLGRAFAEVRPALLQTLASAPAQAASTGTEE